MSRFVRVAETGRGSVPLHVEMGPSATASGLYYAFGFSGSGFQIGPGVGETMAELITAGATDIPVARYAIGRFAAAKEMAL